MTSISNSNRTSDARKPSGRLAAGDLIAQVHAVTGDGDERAAAATQATPPGGGLRAYFKPIAGNRRAGLVSLKAIRTRAEGQVRKGDVTRGEDFAELVASIQLHGVLQPVAVTWDEQADCFWTDFGHRRIEAARAVGLESIPAVISVPEGTPLPTTTLAEQQLIENLQRTQLPALDVAHALSRLIELGIPAAELSRRIGRSRSWVTKHLKLLELPQDILEEAEKRELGHEVLYAVAQADVGPAQQRKLLEIATTEGRPALNRAVEAMAVVENLAGQGKPTSRPKAAKRAYASSRALHGAAKRALAAARHLETLLTSAKEVEKSAGLQRSTSNFIASLERFTKA